MTLQRIIFCLIALAGPTAAAETYVYQEADGTRWITDRQLTSKRFTFIDKYGRSTATRSCYRVTDGILENRAAPYMASIRKHARAHRLETALIKALIRAESCFDAHAVSRAGARGLMQLMPATARQYGVLDRFNPEENLRAGIRHLRDLMDIYNDNIKLSLAAYNAGAHNVEKYDGIPPFRETRGYVKKVLKYYRLYKGDTE